jgi:hypothetical protein
MMSVGAAPPTPEQYLLVLLRLLATPLSSGIGDPWRLWLSISASLRLPTESA